MTPSPQSVRIAEKATVRRFNNFDIVRLALAIVVVLTHTAVLSQSPNLARFFQYFSGTLAVEGFFAISGFLIFASYERCASLGDYCTKRAYRILPAYWLSTLLCLLIAFSGGHFRVGRFLLANLTFANFLNPSIPGVFQGNPYLPDLNGSLWTIKIEVMFYIAVPIILWLCRRLNRDAVLWFLFVSSIIFHGYASRKMAVQLPGQLSFFMIGALVHYHLPFFMKYGRWLMLAAAICYGIHCWTGWFFVRPPAIAGLTLGAALLLPHIKGPTRWGDFSYGTYVLHWPLIQLVVATGLYRAHPWIGFLASTTLIAFGAVSSWFVVEKPALTHAHGRSHRRKTMQPAIISN